ncbi:dTDP-4-amino-4,6-dideoxygalactose transaminase [Pantanalinema sp. GBBB05]|uniref:dTDP-4-amino-4,6-dideoxygalactose transaminase n=1 Tax=Pantanalinema sp. GBBB05 TaxID=2604139 RepID=UPI001D7E9683|nr:dTDP-4-amino-4,6-dideoxygalactose transaminase [Pantanalinema sp. GBBB05]
MHIPFAKLHTTGQELEYIQQAIASGHITGDGSFTKRCQAWLESTIGCQKALLTHSCTAALEMAVILADIQPGDEVILPSYTFVSTANAVVLRGGVPVFVDIRPDTLNLDESKIEAAITPKTKAIMPVHYAGVGCEMPTIRAIADQYNLLVIEDAAQASMSRYSGQPLGSQGHMAAFSFHATKNIVSGEGGALVINDPTLVKRAEIIWEKGTNRSQFFRGEVDKYTWVDIGSSYLPSELVAAFLWAQFQQAEQIIEQRLNLWNRYHKAFAELELHQVARRPRIPLHCQHNGHIYHLLLNDLETRSRLLAHLKAQGIQATFHYVPLHSAPAGQKYGRVAGDMSVTNDLSDRILRLPLSSSLTVAEVDQIIACVLDGLSDRAILGSASMVATP